MFHIHTKQVQLYEFCGFHSSDISSQGLLDSDIVYCITWHHNPKDLELQGSTVVSYTLIFTFLYRWEDKRSL